MQVEMINRLKNARGANGLGAVNVGRIWQGFEKRFLVEGILLTY